MTDTRPSPRDLYILGILSLRPTYGHEIGKAIRRSSANMWVSLSEKHVYYVLRKLAGEGLVTETEKRGGNTPPRKIYEITERGREALRTMLRSETLRSTFIPSPFDAVHGMLAYTDALRPEEAREVLAARREVLRARLQEQHPAEAGGPIEAQFGYLARALYDKARVLMQAELEWMDGVLERVDRDEWESLRVPRDFMDQAGT